MKEMAENYENCKLSQKTQRVAGIICEYNPFHNGHALHIKRTREASDYVICAMSASFVQRGDAAIIDPWTRAGMALSHGADLVLALPPQDAVRPARDFAQRAVGLLSALGVVTQLSFGSELPLSMLTQVIEQGEDSASVKASLARGETWAKAASNGASGDVFHHPNATLGVEYLRALEKLAPHVQPIVIPRETPHEGGGLAEICGASTIRSAIFAQEGYDVAMPPDCAEALRVALNRQSGPASLKNVLPLLLYRLRIMKKGDLDNFPGGGEGLGNRLIAAARDASSVENLYSRVKCKRYTMARIRRLAVHALLDTPQSLLDAPPAFARVLGFRRSATPLLKEIDNKGTIKLLTKPGILRENEAFQFHACTQDIWALTLPSPGTVGWEYSQPIVII